MTIKVLIVDDHRLFRQGLRRVLELDREVQVIGEAHNGLVAQELAFKTRPDIGLMDLNMPTLDGVAATEAILRHMPEVGVIVLTMFDEDHLVSQAMRAGARGYLLKDADAKEVLDAIHAVHQGGSRMDSSVTAKLLGEFRRMARSPKSSEGSSDLTEKERAMLQMLAEGLSNKEIAQRLNYAQSTVKNRLSIIFEKLGVSDRTQAAIYAITHGIASPTKAPLQMLSVSASRLPG